MDHILEELRWRGLIHQTTDEESLARLLSEKMCTIYVGFDPTSDSLHVGNLVALMVLRRFQRAGHRPIAVVGGATGMIGDPSGKSEERNLLSPEAIAANIAGIEPQLCRFLDFRCGANSALLVNNYDWMGKFGYLEFLRDVGKHFPVNVMLTKESVRNRLHRGDAGISYTEFSYMLLQAYDFVYLYDHYDCQIQAGGSDQWGNITAGIDLARRLRGVQLYGITCPLLTRADGSKMGKTESGAVWLSPRKTSPYQFYQYWINVDDADVAKCLKYLTDLGRSEIEQLLDEHRCHPERRVAQRRLAAELTQLVHGAEGLQIAERATQIFFGQQIGQLTSEQIDAIFADVPSSRLPRCRLDAPGLPVIDALLAAGLVKSKSEARRLISQGGAYVNNRLVASQDAVLRPEDLLAGNTVVLRVGKKNYALLRLV